jgi:transposase
VAEGGAWTTMPPRLGRKDPSRARNVVARLFNKIKHFRRIATRRDKLAEDVLAAV